MFDKIFQVLYIVIMTVGILGLPFYFWLLSRKKRLLSEYEENENDKTPEQNEDSENEAE